MNMKKFLAILPIILLTNRIAIAQYNGPKSGLVFRKLFVDYQSQNGGEITTFKDYRHGYEIGYQRMFSDKFGLRLPLRYGVIDSNLDSINCIKKKIASIDLTGQYHFAKPNRSFIPYITAGIGGVIENIGDLSTLYPDEEKFNIQIPVGLGLRYVLNTNAYINWQSEYRFSTAEKRNNLVHGIGFVYMFGKSNNEDSSLLNQKDMSPKDSDGDGVEDLLDLCPAIKGAKELNGCPDKDMDGVADFEDKCIDLPGTKSLNGCPDTDGDGLSDIEDECPKDAGTKENKGCPSKEKAVDSDDDGVIDSEDKCPDIKGRPSAMGCPDVDNDGIADGDDKCPTKAGLKVYNGCPDTDGDGIDDSRDKCPNTAGTVANDGCPEIKKEDRKTLDVAMQAVQFETGSAVLKSESYTVLNQIADILSRYPDFNMVINGHTDNVGSAVANQTLSEKRAKACHDYLLKKGIDADRMTHEGFGESRPISTNETERGRMLNRRVEFNMIPRQ
jgi:outer membrane protein OmpA-like peptidoglycan-associated protein